VQGRRGLLLSDGGDEGHGASLAEGSAMRGTSALLAIQRPERVRWTGIEPDTAAFHNSR
jgi:hypothetical protein